MALQTPQKHPEPHIIAPGANVVLRDALPSDLESYIRWIKQGEWQQYDAPWEIERLPHDENEVRNLFAKKFIQDLATPRTRTIIAAKEDKPVGWVNRYVEKRFPDSWLVGIDICEDDYLNRGIGTEALRLWVDYLFTRSSIHRIGFATYSFNPRMIKVAEKLKFTHEGTDREIIKWQNKWVDRLHYGLLRTEWEH